MTDQRHEPETELETAADAYERNMKRIRTEGLDAATEAAIHLLRDPNSPAQARSATLNAVFRASGLFNKSEDADETEPHEMTADQLSRAIKRLQNPISNATAGKSDSQEHGPFD